MGEAPAVAATRRVKALARAHGFMPARIGAATPLHEERARYLEWIAAGRQGSMRWITPDLAVRASDPASALPDARSVLSVGMGYWAGPRAPHSPQRGLVARYAWGRDYHALMGERLEMLAGNLRRELGGEHRWYVDTGPAMDKALAARSGLGWYGKNTNILTEEIGSWVLLGEIITTLKLLPDPPLHRDCGSCRLCAVACPTGALGPDYSIDARRCISYLTIEHRGAIPPELRRAIGNWVFGCDICQDVCPPAMRPYLATNEARRVWAGDVRRLARGEPIPGTPGSKAQPATPTPFTSDSPIRQDVDLIWLLRLSHEEYVEAFRGTAIKRAKVWMLRRNAAVALGNRGDGSALPALAHALRTDDHPIVRGHAAWAIGEIGSRCGASEAQHHLEEARLTEADPDVRKEIDAALTLLQGPDAEH